MDDSVTVIDGEPAPTPVRRRRLFALRHRRDERGATLVEYALLMAAFVIPTVAAVNTLQHVSKVSIENTAERLSTRAAPGFGG